MTESTPNTPLFTAGQNSAVPGQSLRERPKPDNQTRNDLLGRSQNKKGGGHQADTKRAGPHEPNDIRWMRTCLNRWPFKHGKGILLQLFQPRLRERDFLFQIEPGVLIPAELDDWMVLSFFTDGCQHNLPLQLSRSLIRPGDTVVDIGANVGLWVMGAARRAGPEGDVHAFEPVPENFARLTRNLTLNGLDQVTCRQLALSDKCGHAVFYAATGNNSGLGSLTQRKKDDRPMETEVTTLDDYCEKHAIHRIDLMKVDVEGAELFVFRGTRRLLASMEAPIIMFETDETLTARFGTSSTGIKALLQEHGYDFFRYDGKELEPVAVNESHQKQEDLFALKPFHFERHPLLQSLRRWTTPTART
jgi:FkbM family methyltransferase